MGEQSVRLSVLVPVYNVERFLPRCLESLEAQTLPEIEVLLIDDGSTDGSGEICDAYAAKDARFRVIHQENRGLSAVRNRSLEEAAGEYVMFVDADDWVEPDFCETPWRCAVEQDADVVFFRYRRTKENGEILPLAGSVPTGLIDRSTALDLIFGPSGSYVWDKLWKKSLFRGICFPDVVVYSDVGTSYRLILQAERIVSLDRALYYYRRRRGSNITLRADRAMENYYEMHTTRYLALKELGYNPPLLQARRVAVCLSYAMRRREDPADPPSLLCRQTLRELKTAPKSKDRKHRFFLFLLRHCPPLFELGCVLSGQRREKRPARKLRQRPENGS